ncbi:MAG: PEP-CTERM sorting domain-containing protein [Chthoniobacterales bacterium]|nr:PEP-CTERM sorting domain-containing protein [Chthoniobacterales bacterium]
MKVSNKFALLGLVVAAAAAMFAASARAQSVAYDNTATFTGSGVTHGGATGGGAFANFGWQITAEAPIPEPASFVLFGFGGMALLLAGQRFRRRR